MRTYKTIERPSQVLGMNLQDIFILVGLFLGSVFAMGILGNMVTVSRWVYLVIILAEVALMLFFRYLSTKKPPGFLMAWISFRLFQPRRIRVGALPNPGHGKIKNPRV